MEAIILGFGLVVGYVIGLVQKGIHIHHIKEAPVQDEEQVFNETYSDGIPDDVKRYFEQTKGFLDT